MKRWITAILSIALILSFAIPVSATMAPGLVGYWRFESEAGGVTPDSSGNGNDGTVTDAVIGTEKFGKGYTFNGSSALIDFSNPSEIQTTTNITVCAWTSPDETTRGDIVTQWGGTPQLHFNLSQGITGSKWQFFVSTTGSNAPTSGVSTTTISTGTYYHVCGTFDSSDVILYINGTNENSDSQAGNMLNTSTQDVFMGRDGTTNWFAGDLDEVLIYNRALAPHEIRQIMLGFLHGGM